MRVTRAPRWAAAWAVALARPYVGPACLIDPPPGLLRTIKALVERMTCAISRPTGRLATIGQAPIFDLVAVYRERNGEVIGELAAETTGSVGLWALDHAAAGQASLTVGVGRGTRFENLNRCLSETEPPHWLVVADDDVRMSVGSLADAVALAAAAGLDLAMPSHDVDSFVNWDVTRCRPASMVRLCRFVDQGPLLILSPRARAAIFPLPEEMGMGWGVEVGWAEIDSLRIGIMDGVRMKHLTPVSKGVYDTDAEWVRAQSMLEHSRWPGWRELQEVTQRWRSSRRTPPWLKGRGAAFGD